MKVLHSKNLLKTDKDFIFQQNITKFQGLIFLKFYEKYFDDQNRKPQFFMAYLNEIMH